MHDDEPDTFEAMTWPEKFAGMLAGIGVEAEACGVGTTPAESGDYYSRYAASSPRMVTNRGCATLKGCNIDAVHIVQKG